MKACFERHNPDIAIDDPRDADVIWGLAHWRLLDLWHRMPMKRRNQTWICSLDHIVPSKFGPKERLEFKLRDDVVDVYTTFNSRMAEQARELSPIAG
jgi:hypothetical protein